MIDNLKYLTIVTIRQECKSHAAGIGDACWQLVTDAGQGLYGVCNKRARAAGFVGVIDPRSLSNGKAKVAAPQKATKKFPKHIAKGHSLHGR